MLLYDWPYVGSHELRIVVSAHGRNDWSRYRFHGRLQAPPECFGHGVGAISQRGEDLLELVDEEQRSLIGTGHACEADPRVIQGGQWIAARSHNGGLITFLSEPWNQSGADQRGLSATGCPHYEKPRIKANGRHRLRYFSFTSAKRGLIVFFIRAHSSIGARRSRFFSDQGMTQILAESLDNRTPFIPTRRLQRVEHPKA